MREIPHPTQKQFERFLSRIQVTEDGCWKWTGTPHPAGYGSFQFRQASYLAHRVAYTWLKEPIPEGLDIDHLCRVRICVNPEHLEPVTRQVNLLRGHGVTAGNAAKTHCKHGHEFTEANTYIDNLGCRYCRACRAQWRREKRAAQKARESARAA